MPKKKSKGRKQKQWGSDTDIIIPIMGPTGVGKSTFVNSVANDATNVGHGLNSCTAQIQAVPIPYRRDPSRRVVLVDTPGFDDTYVSDTEILNRIAEWLKTSYKNDKKIAGIIYLHDISQTRMYGSSRHNFQMFSKLCGEDAAKNIILATTKWDLVELHVGEQREKQLEDRFWKDLLQGGSRIVRFNRHGASAWDIIDTVIAHEPINDVLIQRELVELLKILPETEAGNTLRYTLKELVKAHEQAARQLRKDLKEADGEEDRQRLAEVEERLRGTIGQIREMQIPIGRRILKLFGLA